MKKAALFLMCSVLCSASAVYAESMSCVVAVLNAANLVSESSDEAYQVVQIPLNSKGAGEVEVILNGETVSIDLYKKEFADVYSMTMVLKTPVADRTQGTEFVAMGHDYLVNEGPARRGDGPDVQPGAMTYGYLNRDGGSVYLTAKLVKVLKSHNMWGQHPFTSSTLAAQHGYSVAQAVETLLNNKALTASDTVAFATAFNCTKNK
ncbi:hypothetical protein ACNQKP_18105 [Bdellovibrio bacteriovorus]|uniref:hypothetical protein n=1 Tax=Bdellovibrio bacteriovorus TaxID=959 RepID=UPI003AA8B948